MDFAGALGRLSDEEKIFCRHISDLASLSEKRFSVMYTNFLTQREQELAAAALKKDGSASFYTSDGERKIVAIVNNDTLSADDVDFPIVSITFSFRKSDKLTHRDFLGALMALGIKRELIGDIYVGEGTGIVRCVSSIANDIADNVQKIGSVGVKAEIGLTAEIPQSEFTEIAGTVMSLRADSVISEALNLSREKSSELIRQGKVIIDCIPCGSTSKTLAVGAVFTVKGYGKYTLAEIGSLSKKGKTHITIKKYI